MKNETPPDQTVLVDEEVNPEVAVAQPIPHHVNYKTVLIAVVIGIIAIGVLWMFVIRQENNPIKKTLIMEPDIQAEVNEEVKGPHVALSMAGLTAYWRPYPTGSIGGSRRNKATVR